MNILCWLAWHKWGPFFVWKNEYHTTVNGFYESSPQISISVCDRCAKQRFRNDGYKGYAR